MKKVFLTGIISVFLINSCSLDNELQGLKEKSGLSDEQISSGALEQAYLKLRLFSGNSGYFAVQEVTTDECAVPTRGSDWGDGGTLTDLHAHTFNGTNSNIVNSWNDLYQGLFAATEATGYSAPATRVAEGTMLQSFYIFLLTDLFGKVAHRDPNPVFSDNPLVWSRTEAIDAAITNLESKYSTMSSSSTPSVANKYNAAALLAKMYLNRGVYKATEADGTPKVPTATDFTAADMQKVIDNCNIVIGGPFSLATNYFDTFKSNNATASEVVFSQANSPTDGGNLRGFVHMSTHYNQNPSGWNGFITLTDLYNKFSVGDSRLGGSLTGLTDVTGLKAGILVGQQYDQSGNMLKERPGGPGAPNLNFTQSFSLLTSGESSGMRVVKYIPDFVNPNQWDNDFVIFRLADVILMKAEAQFRKGDTAPALATINALRAARGVPTFATLSLQNILDERARELYWETWRRQDQIRFGTFLNPVQERSNTSLPNRMIFPIPSLDLSANPNLTQNPGY